jgi:hypothetical protein
MYVCMYIFDQTEEAATFTEDRCACLHIYIYIYIYMTGVNVGAQNSAYVFNSVCICISVSMYVCMYLCIYTYIRAGVLVCRENVHTYV